MYLFVQSYDTNPSGSQSVQGTEWRFVLLKYSSRRCRYELRLCCTFPLHEHHPAETTTHPTGAHRSVSYIIIQLKYDFLLCWPNSFLFV